MRASDHLRVELGKFAKYFRSEWRRTFSIEYQRAELKKWAQLFRVPPVGTLVLCCLMLGAFVVQTHTGVSRAIQLYGTLPPSLGHLSCLTQTREGQALPVWLTLFPYMFLHGSWNHVISNTIAGWAIGNVAERHLGTWRFLLAYIAGGALGALGLALLLPQDPSPRCGASLAWCYILGAYWATLALDAIRRHGRAMLVLGLEAAAVILLGWRLVLSSGLSKLEIGMLVHPLPIVFGWFTVRGWGGLRRARQTVYERGASGMS